MTNEELFEQLKAIAALPDGLRAIASFPAGMAADLDEAGIQADRTGRPAMVLHGEQPVIVFPRGTKPTQ